MGYRKLDKTYADTWVTRRRVLGEQTYEEFLKSDDWQTLKARAFKRPHYHRCWICKSTDRIELHHTSYKWADRLDLRNVRPICRLHHQQIHDLAKAQDISVRLATNKVFKEFRKVACGVGDLHTRNLVDLP
jgi:hypothetical protein